MIVVITLLANRLNLDSTNSRKPPSSDPNSEKRTRAKNGKKAGAKKGHVDTTLKKVDNPDKIKKIKVERRSLPKADYRQIGFETRQVFDIDISRIVTGYTVYPMINGPIIIPMKEEARMPWTIWKSCPGSR